MSELEIKAEPFNRGSPQNPDWKYLWDTVMIDPGRSADVVSIVKRIYVNEAVYKKIGVIVDCAWWVPGLIHYRESSRLTTDVYLHNGQPLGKRTTIVPKGIYFRKDQFVEAAVDALRSKKLAKVITPVQFLPIAERFNGLGYRNKVGDKGKIEYSPYVWAGTNHHDETSKYVADGKYDKHAKERQLGIAAILKGVLSYEDMRKI